MSDQLTGQRTVRVYRQALTPSGEIELGPTERIIGWETRPGAKVYAVDAIIVDDPLHTPIVVINNAAHPDA